MAAPQQVAAGQGAAGGGTPRKKVLIIAGAAVAVLVVVVGVIVGVAMNSSDNSPAAQVKTAITTYTSALSSGDLDKLRGITCGSQHDFYQNISADQFAGVYKTSKEQKSIPVIKSVDAVQVTGDKAIAQATVYTSDPAKTSARTFDLEHSADGWKVCDPPAQH
ncbi:hypothetical protein ACIP5Y_45410 [Nocardia sp. NPDC088792]|uniref:Rv0361 family membrane protein n=1 Tax=Nocardia sp. NPDC088792 TaxID=3364332 RepID=UPI00380C902B